METEKSCSTCKHRGASWPSRVCVECYEKRPFEYMNWTPKEELVKEYVEKCLPGDNEATVTISKPAYNSVSKPKHYMLFDEFQIQCKAKENQGIEVRDVLEQLVLKLDHFPEGLFISDYVQLMQYLMRFMDKNGKEDLEKARWYLDKMIESY